MHWCNEENTALLSLIPFIGFYFKRIHLWYLVKFGKKCHVDFSHKCEEPVKTNDVPAGFTLGSDVEPGVVSQEFKDKLEALGVERIHKELGYK